MTHALRMRHLTSYYSIYYFYFVLCITFSIIQSWNKREPETSLSSTLVKMVIQERGLCTHCIYTNESVLSVWKRRILSIERDVSHCRNDRWIFSFKFYFNNTHVFLISSSKHLQLDIHLSMEYDLKNDK